MNQIKRQQLIRQLDQIKGNQEFYSMNLPIQKESLRKKHDEKIEKLTFKKGKKLLKHFIRVGILEGYPNALYQFKKDAINKKYDLKIRALKQSFKRKQKSLNDLSLGIQSIESIKKQKLSSLEAYFEKTSTNPEPSKTKIRKSDEALSNNINKLEEQLKKRISQLEQDTASKLEALETSYKLAFEKLELIKKTDSLEDVLHESSILKLDHVSMQFGGLKAVNDLSFDVKKGEIFGLIGPNGAGKTTLFNCITRFYLATEGNIYYRNHYDQVISLNDYQVHHVIHEGIVRTFQNVELVFELNVLDNLLVGAHKNYQTGFFSHMANTKRLRAEEKVQKQKALDILNFLELTPYMYMYPLGLPYGILKKVELARTLMSNPKLIILDEPAAGLNDQETEQLADIIKKIRDTYHTTIFLVEHDMGLVMDICDTVCAISFGKMLAIGTPKDIQQNKLVREAYLGGEADV